MKKIILVCFCFLFSCNIFAEDNKYLTKNWLNGHWWCQNIIKKQEDINRIYVWGLRDSARVMREGFSLPISNDFNSPDIVAISDFLDKLFADIPDYRDAPLSILILFVVMPFMRGEIKEEDFDKNIKEILNNKK